MKLTFSPASPFARKVRIAAIELGLIDKIELVPATVAPGTANEDYSRITPLKKLPVLITNDGDVILDSYVIVEYLNEMAGGSLVPEYGPRRWKTKTMIFSMAKCISYVSQFMTLLPGDIITTGTPPGVGLGMKPPTFLNVGDVVTLGIEGLGEQRQEIIAA